jgi:hypothetical protein
MTLSAYGVTSNRVGYFVLDNAANNDTAIAALAREYNFLTCVIWKENEGLS